MAPEENKLYYAEAAAIHVLRVMHNVPRGVGPSKKSIGER